MRSSTMAPLVALSVTLLSLAPTVLSLGSECTAALGSGTAAASDPFWYETITHQGTSAFGPSGYVVYRNVKDYGATGDGSTDDTAAINAAISDGGRCGNGCASTTITPAVVYFPAGTYVVSSSVIPYYYTTLLGDARDPPTLQPTAAFTGDGVIDADPYGNTADASKNWWGSVNNFFRSVRNFKIDLKTNLAETSSASGIHWQVAQATSLENIQITMSEATDTAQIGVYMEDGSGGYFEDITTTGGAYGVQVGNQQFTARSININNAQKGGIYASWDWGWSFINTTISNSPVGFHLETSTDHTGTAVGAEYILDSTITDVPTFVQVSVAGSTSTVSASLVIDNAQLSGVTNAVADGDGNALLAGGDSINLWVAGAEYQGTGAKTIVQQTMTDYSKPAGLLDSSGKIYGKSRPQYEAYAADEFVSVKTSGAKGDGTTDDTAAVQAVFDDYAGCKIIYFDAGTYYVTGTIKVPEGSIIVGEYLSVILAGGDAFSDQSNPTPVFQVGNSGDSGSLEISNMLFSTVGGSAGAVMIEWNIAASSQGSAGMWDTHVRLGGADGTDLQVAQCPTTGSYSGNQCTGSFLDIHLTAGSSAYISNMWDWVADHDMDDASLTQIDVFAGRGMLIESTDATWLIGTASEHHTMYQYNLASASNIFMGLIQTETPYYQPSPAPPSPFSVDSSISDPTFPSGQSDAWALYIQGSSNIIVGGAGLYSFFQAYDQSTCVADINCQQALVNIDSASTNIRIYSLTTVGVVDQLDVDQAAVALAADNTATTTSQTLAIWVSSDSTLRRRDTNDTEERVRRSRIARTYSH